MTKCISYTEKFINHKVWLILDLGPLNSQNSNFRHQKSDKYHAVIVGSTNAQSNCQKNKLLKCLKPEVNAKK